MYISIFWIIVLGFVVFSMYSNTKAKKLYIQQLEDTIDLIEISTTSRQRIRVMAKIFTICDGAGHNINFERLLEFVHSVSEEGIYHQVYSDIDSVNKFHDYHLLAEQDLEVLKKVAHDKNLSRDNINNLLKKYSK